MTPRFPIGLPIDNGRLDPELTPERLARTASMIPGFQGDPNGLVGINLVRITHPVWSALLYENDAGDFVVGADGDEVAVPVPAGTLCEVCEIEWISADQGVAFHLKPIGDAWPDPVPGQFDEADLVDGKYPFEVVT